MEKGGDGGEVALLAACEGVEVVDVALPGTFVVGYHADQLAKVEHSLVLVHIYFVIVHRGGLFLDGADQVPPLTGDQVFYRIAVDKVGNEGVVAGSCD